MWGISYGGFTAIQVAKLRPPHLRAIVPDHGDRRPLPDDVHYLGGCVDRQRAQPVRGQPGRDERDAAAMPRFRGDGWRDEWRARLEATPPWLFDWLRQQHDGPYWRQGSLAPGLRRDRGGDPAHRRLDGRVRRCRRCGCRRAARAPIRTLVGNWVHGLPTAATPGPNLDWLHEMVRFFDRWLKGIDERRRRRSPPSSGSNATTPSPSRSPSVLPGRWRAAERLSAPVRPRARRGGSAAGAAAAGRRGSWPTTRPSSTAIDRYRHRPTVGTRAALSWGAGGPPNGLARDLRPDEALGPTYTSAPLDGAARRSSACPRSSSTWPSSAPVATAVVRLTDVAPDGTSAQVSAGILNLTHRRSHERPEPLEPGRVEEVRVPLRPAGYRFAAGHRIRVSVASSAWPVVWPSPFAAEFELHRGPATPSRLDPAGRAAGRRPGRRAGPGLQDDAARPAAGRRRGPRRRRRSGGSTRTSSPAASRSRSTTAARTSLDDGRRLYAAETMTLTAFDADPARASLDADVVYRWQEHGDSWPRSGHAPRQTSDASRLRPDGRPRGRPRRRAVLPADLDRDDPAASRLSGPGS